jgi:hypothetical protein
LFCPLCYEHGGLFLSFLSIRKIIMDIFAIHLEALQAAKSAEAAFLAKHGEPMFCGFAWVRAVVSGNTKLGRDMKKVGFSPMYGASGLQLWNPAGSHTQSMDLKEAGARAYADVLNSHGIKAYVGTRAD